MRRNEPVANPVLRYCSVVCICHRRGLRAIALRAIQQLQIKGMEVPSPDRTLEQPWLSTPTQLLPAFRAHPRANFTTQTMNSQIPKGDQLPLRDALKECKLSESVEMERTKKE